MTGTGHIHRERFTLILPTYARRELFNAEGQSSGFTSDRVGTEQVQVEVEIDVKGIANDLGPRARRSKRRRATGLGGLVVVRYTT